MRKLIVILLVSLVVIPLVYGMESGKQTDGCEDLVSSFAAVISRNVKEYQNNIEKLDRSFEEAFSMPGIYENGFCNGNVKRLFDWFQEDIGLHFTRDDFNVLAITHKSRQVEVYADEILFTPLQKRNELNMDGQYFVEKVPQEWMYHIVLEYQGRIYDLDFMDTPRPVEVAEYFELNFVSGNSNDLAHAKSSYNSRSDLVVTVFPGEDYLRYLSDYFDYEYELQLFINGYDSIPMTQFTK